LYICRWFPVKQRLEMNMSGKVDVEWYYCIEKDLDY
jgi:hypothetical protein